MDSMKVLSIVSVQFDWERAGRGDSLFYETVVEKDEGAAEFVDGV